MTGHKSRMAHELAWNKNAAALSWMEPFGRDRLLL